MMRLDGLTWAEVKRYLENRQDMIIPIGTCEQHGKHLPLKTDTIIAERICDFLSEKTGIVVSPTVNYGINLPCDRYYSGTNSLTIAVLQGLLSAMLKWWRLQGFDKFYLVSAHGDPFHLKALAGAGAKKDDVRVLELYDLEMSDILQRQKCARHAGEAETSVMLFLYPEMVRRDSVEDFETPPELFKDYLTHSNRQPIEGSPGCQGYPSAASKEKGEVIFSRMKKRALVWIKEDQKKGRNG